ncbi:lytic transglycosylase domain-containing protein [Tardiphaga alba]|uniref:Lytic transglycosylase domain-containing protein n=1 Tax=Tardiphaga alba TaxID=340268 RepID=A0ABX8ADA8_9BRAD|nr:transglycosylase SLT domain-containing protein [Tardiphaga alba]QUS40624.1 lytic transglycosylase domain-containing protein [Tardiphaga alba]
MAVEATNLFAVNSTRSQVAGAIKNAAGITGTSFEYLLATAKMESNFDPKATASTSSAKGLFQFIEQTWLGTVKEAGSQLGYGQYADAITKSPSGSYSVSDPKAKAEILKLRDDPVASSAMAGVLTQSNSFKLSGEIGRRPNDAELYMAHFMGVAGASKLINNAAQNPNLSGAALFPNAAAANRSIFYDQSGSARSVSQVYGVLSSRYTSAANSSATVNAMATAGVTTAQAVAPTTSSSASGATFLSRFPDLNNVQVASFASGGNVQAAPEPPMFRSLFQGGERSQPISPAVQELWGNSSSLTSNALPKSPEVGTPRPLDLFSDRFGTFSS